MTEIYSSWLVGSFTLASTATITVNGNAHNVAAGTYYLRDATTSISLVDAVQAAIAAEVGGSTVAIGKDRKLRIISGGGALTLLIPAVLQAVLGLAAAPTVGTTVTADNVSTLLWSPGWPATTEGFPVDASGWTETDLVITTSPSGLTQNFTAHNTQTLAEWTWSTVKPSRVWTSAALGGEYRRFFDDVLLAGSRFKFYSRTLEDEASSASVSWVTAKGPYRLRNPNFRWYRRTVASTDAVGAELGLEAILTSEIT